MLAVLSSVFAFLLTVHNALYHPVFPALPQLGEQRAEIPATMTLPVRSAAYSNPPVIEAESYMVIDQDSGEVLSEHNPDKQLFPASTTKVMTALVVLRRMPLDQVITVPSEFLRDGSHAGLIPGEQLTVHDLLVALLIPSGNDAASVLARTYPGGEGAFVQAMNEEANVLHLDQTHFTNPSGLYDPRHVTSVHDLLIIARTAMKHPEFAAIVKMKQATITSEDGKIIHKLESTDELLGKVEGVEGIKTGWTEEAGECLVTQTTRNGHTFLTAVLHSPDRFGEMTKLIEWGFSSYQWKTQSLQEWAQSSE